MEVSEAAAGYLLFKSGRASPRTIETDTVLFRQFCQWLGTRAVDEVTPEDVRRYLEFHTKRGLSPYTVHRHHAVLSALYSWLTSPDIALAKGNPVASVIPPKLPKRIVDSLGKDDITALLKAADHVTCKRRAKAIVLFLLDSGARATELCGVGMEHVTWSNGRVTVIGKGDRQRHVYLGRRALASLWLYVKEERPEPARVGDDHLFLTDDGYELNRGSLRHIITRLAEHAGIKATPHQFRHSAAIEHLRGGMDLISLQHLLGHESVEVTRGYLTSLRDEDVADAARRTSPTDNWRL